MVVNSNAYLAISPLNARLPLRPKLKIEMNLQYETDQYNELIQVVLNISLFIGWKIKISNRVINYVQILQVTPPYILCK